ncbi:unnamed protein product [Mytilus coruscus]|uniref:CCHC-type domain-containing protein n=1 Tax=Mytilus coruscus TaxID=42192 RepID=A0A6J8AYD5_MYTCO|nr:unnamed protein product [Mytilus coruscus]
MDFNLKPQWSMWRHSRYQYPACGKCGLAHHRFEICQAYNKRCFSCDKFGHFARQCYTVRSSLFGKIRSTKSTNSKVLSVQKKSKKSKKNTRQRDNQRLIQYYTTKNSLRELPFSNVRNSFIIIFFDQTAPLKVELTQANIQLQKNKSIISETSNLLKNVQEEVRTLTCKLEDSQNQPDSSEQLKECLEKIGKLEKENEYNSTCIKTLTDQNNFFILKSEYQTFEIEGIAEQNQDFRKNTKILTDQFDNMANQIRICRTQHTNHQNASQWSENRRFKHKELVIDNS